MAVTFVDRVVLHLSAGAGGHGVASVKREKFKPLGGPDGGNGGHGGSVILRVDPQATTLLDYHRHPHRKAVNGLPGAGDEKNGADGDDLVLSVPEGTVVKDGEGRIVMDLVGMGTEHVIARGGRGGLGNKALSSARRRAPGVALIGFPSAGKSSLVSVLSAAKPKIADYPFTTLVPNLGVVTAGSARFTVADVPGLIPGAHEGKGLGLEFLRHVERCSVLVHVIDCATYEPGRDPASDIEALELELAEYTPALSTDLADRPRLVVLNKIDVPEARELADFVRPDLESTGYRVFEVSTATHEGLDAFRYALAEVVRQDRERRPAQVGERIVLRPAPVNESQFAVQPDPEEDGGFIVRGTRPERWVRQTDFTNDEAVGYLADRLARLGVEDALVKVGATAGASVTIGDITFEWEPATPAGLDTVASERGTDQRLDRPDRIGAAERKALHRLRRGLDVEGHQLDRVLSYDDAGLVDVPVDVPVDVRVDVPVNS